MIGSGSAVVQTTETQRWGRGGERRNGEKITTERHEEIREDENKNEEMEWGKEGRGNKKRTRRWGRGIGKQVGAGRVGR